MTRFLRRPVFWTAGLTLGDVLVIAVVLGAGLPAVVLCVIALLSRPP